MECGGRYIKTGCHHLQHMYSFGSMVRTSTRKILSCKQLLCFAQTHSWWAQLQYSATWMDILASTVPKLGFMERRPMSCACLACSWFVLTMCVALASCSSQKTDSALNRSTLQLYHGRCRTTLMHRKNLQQLLHCNLAKCAVESAAVRFHVARGFLMVMGN